MLDGHLPLRNSFEILLFITAFEIHTSLKLKQNTGNLGWEE